jgi:hypothetical protein
MPERYHKQNFNRKTCREDRIDKTCGRIYNRPAFLQRYFCNCSHLGRLLLSDHVLVVAPSTFRSSLLNEFVFGKVRSDCWALVSVRAWLMSRIMSS